MKPKTISASSLQNAQDCPALFKAKNIDFIPESGKKEAAWRGSAVHYALEHFVRQVYLEKTASWDDLALLEELYYEGYMKEFLTADRQTEWYTSGWEMVLTWHERTDLTDVEVLSVEQKRRTPVPSARYDRSKPASKQARGAAIVPLTYIWDRCDRYIHPVTGNRVIRVVDYKTVARPLSADAIRRKLQAKVYACAAMLYFKDEMPDEIRIQIDLLQFDPVEVVFTPEECVQIWIDLRRELQRILDIHDNARLERRVGPHCKYCPVAVSCKELQRNIDGEGIHALDTPARAQMRAEVQARREALGALIAQLDDHLLAEAEAQDVAEFPAGDHLVRLKMSSRRHLDQRLALAVLGVDRYVERAPMTMKDYDALMKGDELGPEEKKKLVAAVEMRWSDKLTVEVVLDDEGGE